MRPIAFECRKCGHFFSPIKAPKSHIRRKKEIYHLRCPRCRAGNKYLWKITAKDIKVLWKWYKKEPWNLETMEIALRLKEKETQKYQSLDDINPEIIKIYLTQSKHYKHPEKAVLWLEKKGYDHQDASTIINFLQKTFFPWKSIEPIKPPEPEPEPMEEPPKEPEYEYCYFAPWCDDPRMDLMENSRGCSNKNREVCYNKAKIKFQDLGDPQ